MSPLNVHDAVGALHRRPGVRHGSASARRAGWAAAGRDAAIGASPGRSKCPMRGVIPLSRHGGRGPPCAVEVPLERLAGSDWPVCG